MADSHRPPPWIYILVGAGAVLTVLTPASSGWAVAVLAGAVVFLLCQVYSLEGRLEDVAAELVAEQSRREREEQR